MARIDGRANDQLRSVVVTPHYLDYAEGSALVTMGQTRVLCAATIEEKVPAWLVESGRGWITGEYALLPRSTHTRTQRESDAGRLQGRTQEIRRLIGRSLRMVLDLSKFGPRTCIVDCDVIQADGGTRTAAVTGGYVALALALRKLIRAGKIPAEALRPAVAAVSVGIVGGELMLDLCYQEDSRADADVNVVMTAEGRFVEVQGTAEGKPFARAELDGLLDLAAVGIRQLFRIQEAVIDFA
jgi:ribonuclease PH